MIEITSSLHAFECLRAQFNPYAEEVWVLALNSQMRLVKQEMISRGTVDYCLLHPRDLFRTLALCNAHSFILAHNHPSHEIYPSDQDLIITKKIYRLSKMFEITMNDHIIFTNSKYLSFIENGLFKPQRRLG